MTSENDIILSKLTVRLEDPETSIPVGSGLLYSDMKFKDKIYVLTAAHNLYKDADSFTDQRNTINVNIYNAVSKSYDTINHTINFNLSSPSIDKDIAILVLDRNEVETITGILPAIHVVKERQSFTSFVLKGFPNATRGEELAAIYPIWTQSMTGSDKFQLQLTEDYTSWATGGFSGSGIFLHANNHLYLYGIFTRFRAEGKGKVIYGQYIETFNELLANNYQPLILFSFLAAHGLTESFFNAHVDAAIQNLGPRFTQELNFQLPIASLFNDIAKDSIFRKRLLNILDNWLVAKNFSYYAKDSSLLTEIESDLLRLRDVVTNWLSQIAWDANMKIDIHPILQEINALNTKTGHKKRELYELQWKERDKDPEKKRGYDYRPPFEAEISRLRDIEDNNHQFLSDLNTVNIALSNNPILIIQGEAGCGKSHLLGDIAHKRQKNREPVLLLLGQLFKSGQTVWQNVLAQIEMSCSKEELLFSLNSIGRQQGSRFLILIDALNEGAGKELWLNELAGFIADVKRYPFIGLVLTVRSTYYNAVIPPSIQSNKEITKVTHEGFKGNEYEALRLFCEHYGLEQPNFPILAPEFANPLFLQLICQGVSTSNRRTFPQGFQGISTIFGFYIKALNARLGLKRDEYRLRPKLVEQAILEMAEACFRQQSTRTLPLEKAVELFDNKFSKFRHLLDDLIQENVFIQSLVDDYKSNADIEVVYFSYERFGDYFIAEKLLQPYTRETVKVAFGKGNELGALLEDSYWRNDGILEALSVLLPEKFNLEIVEVFDWVFEINHENLPGNTDEWLNQCLLNSFKWRKTETVDNEKLTNWFMSEKFNVDHNNYFNSIIELTTLRDHPFNGNRLFRMLKHHTMPERDAFWQQYLRLYTGFDDDGHAFPLQRLIDWAWLPQITYKLDSETARLTGQTLSWILSSTYRALRDQVTKAMVNLLEEQPDALIAILNSFSDIDDPYILERLYGIAYGCVLRTSTNPSIVKIAQYVFDTIFKAGQPPEHILLRDYARNIIEYAVYKQLPIEGDISLIRPPYNSQMPQNIPTKEQLSVYKIDHTAADYKENYGFYYNQIRHSVMDWDFGRYTVDGAIRDFNPISFRAEKEYKEFLKTLKKQQKQFIKSYEKMLESKFMLDRNRDRLIEKLGQKPFDNMLLATEKCLLEIPEYLKSELTNDQINFVNQKIIPQLVSIQRLKNWHHNHFDTEPIKCWIVQRAFELGYNADWHGPYESSIASYNNRSENKIERIGKKYQWIAFHEILAKIADNYKIKDGWGSNPKYEYYRGPWQGYLRDIDPAFVTKNRKDKESDADEDFESQDEDWRRRTSYNYWNSPYSEWVNSIEDLPDPRYIIQRTDYAGTEWVYLNSYMNLEEPKPIGEEKYKSRRRNIWYIIQGYVIRKKEKPKIIKWLQQQNFKGRWMPESHKANLSLFNRENYWSPASQENEVEKWEKIEDSPHKVMVATSQAVGELSSDKSGAHFGYDMPCKLIFDGMKLQYAPNDGDFKNELGEIIVTSDRRRGVLANKREFLKFLANNNLDLVWVLLGEKRTLGGDFSRQEFNYYTTLNGLYYFDKGSVTGKLWFANED